MKYNNQWQSPPTLSLSTNVKMLWCKKGQRYRYVGSLKQTKEIQDSTIQSRPDVYQFHRKRQNQLIREFRVNS